MLPEMNMLDDRYSSLEPKTIKGETDGSGYLIEIGQKRTTVLNLAILIRWRHQVAGECKACSHSLQLLGSDL